MSNCCVPIHRQWSCVFSKKPSVSCLTIRLCFNSYFMITSQLIDMEYLIKCSKKLYKFIVILLIISEIDCIIGNTKIGIVFCLCESVWLLLVIIFFEKYAR